MLKSYFCIYIILIFAADLEKNSINLKHKDMIKTEIKKVDVFNNAAIIEKTLLNCLGHQTKKYQIIDFSYFD